MRWPLLAATPTDLLSFDRTVRRLTSALQMELGYLIPILIGLISARSRTARAPPDAPTWSGREMFKIFRPELPALFVALAFSTPSIASSCNHEIVVPIKFPPGKLEWAFRGKGTHFFGFFQKGQSLNIAGAGGSHDVSGDFSWASSSTDPWQITIEGPNGFIQVPGVETEGVLYVEKLPATGKYVISIGPCADWGESGTLVIHASDPRLTID
jgi:hypothetical protein